jgi:hypothetical protein
MVKIVIMPKVEQIQHTPLESFIHEFALTTCRDHPAQITDDFLFKELHWRAPQASIGFAAGYHQTADPLLVTPPSLKHVTVSGNDMELVGYESRASFGLSPEDPFVVPLLHEIGVYLASEDGYPDQRHPLRLCFDALQTHLTA